MKINNNVQLILQEVGHALEGIDDQEVEKMINAITKAQTIVLCGAGRTGFIASTFAMRLYQLGLTAYTHKDENIPNIKENDLVIACSGSGETKSVYDYVAQAKTNNSKVIFVTTEDGNMSPIEKLANLTIVLQTPSKYKTNKEFTSNQPLGSLYEQSLFVFFEALVLSLMEKLNQTHNDMKTRYINLH